MINNRFHSVSTAIVAVTISAGALTPADVRADEPRPPAGQMCPQGAYVIGFDAESNIVCSDIPTAPPVLVVPAPAATAPATAQPAAAASVAPTPAAGTAAPTVIYAPAVIELDIEDIEPSSVVYGKREMTVRIIGSGFGPGSIVRFQGQQVPATPNAAGTELTATLPTRDLSIGAYAITVENPGGARVTLKRAIEVY